MRKAYMSTQPHGSAFDDPDQQFFDNTPAASAQLHRYCNREIRRLFGAKKNPRTDRIAAHARLEIDLRLQEEGPGRSSSHQAVDLFGSLREGSPSWEQHRQRLALRGCLADE